MAWCPVLSSAAISCFELYAIGKDLSVSRSERLCLCLSFPLPQIPSSVILLCISQMCAVFFNNIMPITSISEVSLHVFLSVWFGLFHLFLAHNGGEEFSLFFLSPPPFLLPWIPCINSGHVHVSLEDVGGCRRRWKWLKKWVSGISHGFSKFAVQHTLKMAKTFCAVVWLGVVVLASS